MVVEIAAVTAVICGVIYWEMSCRRGSRGCFVGVAGDSGIVPLELMDKVSASFLRSEGAGDVFLVMLRGRSRSVGFSL